VILCKKILQINHNSDARVDAEPEFLQLLCNYLRFNCGFLEIAREEESEGPSALISFLFLFLSRYSKKENRLLPLKPAAAGYSGIFYNYKKVQ